MAGSRIGLWATCVVLLGLAEVAGADATWPPDQLFSEAETWLRGPSSARPTGTVRASESAGVRSESEPAADDVADEEDPIETDRDSFTPATTTVGRRRLVVESAYSFIDNRKVAETHSYPELLLRYGLTERIELRAGWNYEVGGAGNSTSGQEGGEASEPMPPSPDGGMGGAPPRAEESQLERAARIAYGVKLALTEQEGLFPQSAAILQGFTPTEGPSRTTTYFGTYVLGWKLLSGCKLDAAVRYGTAEEEGDRFGLFAPSVVLRVPVGGRCNVHAEWFGAFADHREEDGEVQYVSPGVHYLITPDCEIGVRVGWGLTEPSARFFCNSGVALRF